MADLTPMVAQYQEIKSRHRDAILLFRLGDFYKMFNDDAVLASKELEITLTGRGEGEGRMPMCGVPFHSVDPYIKKLIDRGHKVAICEQVEDPKLAKGLVKREVIKIISPGTVIETSMLNEKNNNYLLAMSFGERGEKYGLAYIDVSTGEFRLTEIAGERSDEKFYNEIKRINPAEILIPDMVP
ncbi:MAG: DNA mismatch repair protein MutS, partial [Candidatus Saganbacteria bacterium]|nr:DNA mismatch repair protein MutS [Candidatus Saganbacteria bacterium]